MSSASKAPPYSPFAIGWLLLALAVPTGCLGGQTGTESRETPGSATDNSPCEDEKETVSAQDTSLGYSANDVFGFVLGARTTELAWGTSTSSVSFGPETGTNALELEVAFNGEVRRVTSVARGNSSGAEITLGCPGPRLEADVTLRMVSAGGALDESLPAILTIRDPHFAELSASAKVASLAGSFSVTPGPGAIADTLSIRALFAELGHAGVLTGSVETSSGGSASQGVVGYGRWPANSPCSSGYDPVVAAAPPLSLQQALEQLSSSVPETLRWNSGDSTTIAFDVTTGGSACVTPPSDGLPAGLALPIALSLRTGDGRVDTMLAGTLTETGNDTRVELRAGRSCDGQTPAAQASACGLQDLDIDAYDHLSLSLSASISEADGANGELTLFGVPPTSCEPTPNSSCGSPGPSAIVTGRF